MSLAKMQEWMTTSGRLDVTEGLSEREKEVFDQVARIAMDLDGVIPHQGAKVGKLGEHLDLNFGRMLKGRKTPVIFCGLLFAPRTPPGDEWQRKDPPPEKDTVRLYVRLSETGVERSPWSYMAAGDDSLKPDPEWRYVEIPERVPLDGEELLDLIEDAYFEVVGI